MGTQLKLYETIIYANYKEIEVRNIIHEVSEDITFYRSQKQVILKSKIDKLQTLRTNARLKVSFITNKKNNTLLYTKAIKKLDELVERSYNELAKLKENIETYKW